MNSLGNVLSLQKTSFRRNEENLSLQDVPSCLLSYTTTVVTLSAQKAMLVSHTELSLLIPTSGSTLFYPLGPGVVAKSF